MKTTNVKLILGLCGAAALFTGTSSFAQVSLTSTTGNPYTQNFSSMGTGTTLPTGWSGVSEAGTHNTFSPNVPGENNDGVAAQNENFTAGALSASSVEFETPTQGSSTGKSTDVINWVNSAADIAAGEGTESLGTDPSGNAATIIELSLTNNTGAAISSLNVGYDIDRFTTISNTNSIPTGAPNTGLEEFPGYHLFYSLTPTVASSWVDVTALDPTVNMGTVAGQVSVPNSVGITTVNGSVILSSALANGSTMALAWFDDNGYSPSPDQEIGLNNVSIQAVPEPSSIGLGLIAACLGTFMMIRRRQEA